MAFPKIEEVRDLSDSELSEQILATKRQLFELRLQKATRRLEKPHEFKHARHRLAQLMTVEGDRQRAAATAQASGNSSEPSATTSADL